MSILITGASGFIGKYLVDHFCDKTDKLIAIGSKHEFGSEKNITAVNIRLPSTAVVELIKTYKPSLLIHAAGCSSVPQSVKEPSGDYVAGPPVVFQLLDAIRLYSPHSRFLFLSSAAVYGNPERLPIQEHSETMPISPYGFHKRQSELIVQEFSQIYGISTVSARIFSTYGNGLRKQLLWDLCQKAANGKTIPVLGDGSESRDFLHVHDVCRAIELIASQPSLCGQPINLCSGIQTPIREVAILLASQFPHQPPIEFTGGQLPGSPMHWQGDCSWLESKGFTWSVSLETGIKDYVSWFLQYNV